MSNKQEDFNAQLNKNVILEQLFDYSKVSYIKGALIITSKDLKKVTNWKKDQQVSIPAKESPRMVTGRNNFEMQEDNKLRVNLKHLVHYTLSQIVYIDNYYNIHKALKIKNFKYLVNIYQIPSKLNTKMPNLYIVST